MFLESDAWTARVRYPVDGWPMVKESSCSMLVILSRDCPEDVDGCIDGEVFRRWWRCICRSSSIADGGREQIVVCFADVDVQDFTELYFGSACDGKRLVFGVLDGCSECRVLGSGRVFELEMDADAGRGQGGGTERQDALEMHHVEREAQFEVLFALVAVVIAFFILRAADVHATGQDGEMPDFEIVGVDARWGKCFLQNFTQLSADDESLVIFFVLVREGQERTSRSGGSSMCPVPWACNVRDDVSMAKQLLLRLF